MAKSGEGSKCTCETPEQHQAMVDGVIASGLKDPERAALALKVATSEALVRRRKAALNGH